MEHGSNIPPLKDSDLELYQDIAHLPISLKRVILENEEVMLGYCNLFAVIKTCLEMNHCPTPALLHKMISAHPVNPARRFLGQVGGDASYAVEYLMDTLKAALSSHKLHTYFAEGLCYLPFCFNDGNFWIVKDRLLAPEKV
jgi:hypothetical protein